MDSKWNGEYRYDYGSGYGSSSYGYDNSGESYSENYANVASETVYSNETMESDMNYGTKSTSADTTIQKKIRKKKVSTQRKIARAAAYGLVFGLVAGASFGGINYGISKLSGESSVETSSGGDNEVSKQTTVTPANSTGTLNYDVAEIAANAKYSVVSINTVTKNTVQYFFQTYEQESEGAGSGIIIGQTEDVLYISTNYHVIEGASAITVGFTEGSLIDATVKGYDADYDIAVLEVKKSDIDSDTLDTLTVASIGNSDSLAVGEPAIAMGNPLGTGLSVTVGYISALSKSISNYSGTFIQTDAAINPGNSGGALLNSKGEVIGITSSKYVDSSVEGMGFAIPINKAMELVDDIINGTNNARLGIGGVDITSDYASIYGFPEGIYVKTIESGSAAERGGLRESDIIVNIDGADVKQTEELARIIKSHKVGDEITLKIYRVDNTGRYNQQEITITL
jgi:serine protease Do